ncbi:heterogeneous nuclear ribonucleoprotein U-like protein 1 [Hippopotamus amphibius kiboko]|uniref:heterogeneous nuclear ribonucleoprotein U-like protein 1 n=1 Tax=Hippopotamus amphibius kiboko TaxID=575201 RepID=UPI00259AA298|nr:heterogeneous nuclear ribonucleoprotein U-like protein 1 [Hippopotamus amphibius kiboko]
MGEGAGGPRSGRGRGGGRGEVRRPEGRGGAGGGEGGEGRGEGRGREGAGGERSSRVTSPTRRRGHRRRRRHFNRTFGLRSALSVWAKEPTRSASRSHSSASPPPSLRLPPPTSSSAHTPRAPHPAATGSLPSLSSSVGPPRPRSTPSARSPTPPSPDLCQRWRSKERVAVARRRPPRPPRGPRGPASAGSLAPPRPPPLRFAILSPGSQGGLGTNLSRPPLRAQAFGMREAVVGTAGWGDAAAQVWARGPLPAGFCENGTAWGRVNLQACFSPASTAYGSSVLEQETCQT